MTLDTTPVEAPDFDYGDDGQLPDQDAVAALAELDRLVLRAERATRDRQLAEDILAKAKKAEELLLNKEIPDLLRRLRLDAGRTASGVDFKIKRDIRASLPGHDRPDARAAGIKWLNEHGHGGIIKNKISVDLDRGEDVRATELEVDLRAKGFDVTAIKDVHPSTLAALVRELMEGGKIIPTDCFSLFDQRVVKLTRK